MQEDREIGSDRRTREENLANPIDDNPLAHLETMGDDAQTFDLPAEFNVATLGRVIRAHDIDVLTILIGQHGHIVDQQCVVGRVSQ